MDQDHGLSFASDVKPLFRDSDRASMLKAFDLWSHDDVVRFQDAIVDRLADGTMPCDGAWPESRVDVIRSWIAQGSRP
jgi:hypothetical protein